MKILAVYNPLSGGSYHRVKLWSEFVENVTIVQDLTEELVKECNILYIHWNSKTPITTLSIWREKYGFKIIADIDDVWQNNQYTKHTDFLSQHLCLLADQVICSTEYLVPGIMEWNKNVTVIPNLLPIDHGQFTPKTKVHKKIRVGIGGSISHYEDYMSLRGLIRKLESKDWFNKNYEFCIIGYDNLDQRWRNVNNMFKNVKLFKYKSPEEYMSLYDEVDIMLLPLLDTEMNRGRSNLKVHECISKGVLPIISPVYRDKDEKNTFIPLIQEDVVRAFCINQEVRMNKLKDLYFNFIEGHDYEITCVESRKWIFENISRAIPFGTNHSLFSVTYNIDQDVEYTNIVNKVNAVFQKSYLFEYNPIINVTNNQKINGNYLAFFSHKFPHKTGFYKKYVEEVLDNEDSDVVIFCKQIPNYFEWTETQHPGFMDLFIKVCQKLKLVIPSEYPVVYSNFFAAKKEVYLEYVTLLKKAILVLHSPEIKELAWMDANYKTGLNSEDLKKYTGLDHYTFHTFILERLISVWIINKGLTYAVYT